ncbi:MAG TPA: acyltransferase family protein [Streptosporangiaceae bacterium]|nr:acyltransferase family protein [Streptosporangiaceae bacterium]
MPKPVEGNQRYVAGLDGLRALAVLAVIAYHVDLGWAQGGLLGVGIFFTLSGYLITDLLMAQQATTGRLQLLRFWQRRARRLLPALFVMLTVVTAWVALVQRAQLPALRGAVAAAVCYVSNWWLIAQNSSYFARFAPPTPLGHLWSLAVEEQFYLLWPWLIMAGLYLTRRQHEGARRGLLAGGTLALAAVSCGLMIALYHPGYDPTRVYDGTDTRAFALLIGAALAIALPSREMPAQVSRRARLRLDGLGAAGLIVIALLIWRTSQYSPFLYRGGMVLLSVATAAVVLAVVSPAGRLGTLLGWSPLRWLGVRSYGIYLWHYPIIVLTTPASGRETPLRATLQVGASIVVAALSWRLVEEPIRHGAVGRWFTSLRAAGWHAARREWATLTAACWVLGFAVAALAGAMPAASAGSSLATTGSTLPPAAEAGSAGAGPGASTSATAAASGPGFPLKTSCTAVVHFGDSTSDGLVSADYLPDPAQRIKAQYADVGVRRTRFEIEGGTSIVETIRNEPNAYTLARALVRHGYRGCWVLALGTNDTADVAVGSYVGVAARIERMMSVIHGEPALWVNVKSLLDTGPYAERNMQAWNHALLRACARYPNMKVFNWAALAQRQWFIPDGIHYTSAGYVQRSRLIARALALAFPQASSLQRLPSLAQRLLAAQQRASCVVS